MSARHPLGSRRAHPQPGFTAVGRLLLVGLGAGAVIGGATGAASLLLGGPTSYGEAGTLIGASAGLVTGVLANLLSGVLLLSVVTAGPDGRDVSARTGRLLLLAVPVPTAAALAWAAFSASNTAVVAASGVAVAVGLAVLAVLTTASWVLAPLACGDRLTRRS